MAGDSEFFAMVCQEVMEGFGHIKDAIIGIRFNLFNGPIPHTSEMPQPGRDLLFLMGCQPQFELALQHVRRVSVARYIA